MMHPVHSSDGNKRVAMEPALEARRGLTIEMHMDTKERDPWTMNFEVMDSEG